MPVCPSEISALIAFDTEYCDPEMFISDKPKVEIRRDMNGSSVISVPRVAPKPSLRNTKSCQVTPQYDTIGVNENTHGREVRSVCTVEISFAKERFGVR